MFRKIVSIIISLSLFSNVAFPPEAMASIGLGGTSNGSFSIQENLLNEDIVGVANGGSYILTSGFASTIEYPVSTGTPVVEPTVIPHIVGSYGHSIAGRLYNQSTIVESGFASFLAPIKPIQRPGQYIPNQILESNQNGLTVFDLDDFFVSPAGYDLTYTTEGLSSISVTIDANNVASLSWPLDYTGTEELYFVATDTNNQSVTSNPVTCQIVTEYVENPLFEVLEKYLEGVEFTPNKEAIIQAQVENANGETVDFSFTAVLDVNGNWHFDYANGEGFNLYQLLDALSNQLNFKFNFFIPESLLSQYTSGEGYAALVSTNQAGGQFVSNDSYEISQSAIAQPLAKNASNSQYVFESGIVPVFSYRLAEDSIAQTDNSISSSSELFGETVAGVLASDQWAVKSGMAYKMNAAMPLQKTGKMFEDLIVKNIADATNIFDLDDYFYSPNGLALSYSIVGNDVLGVNISSDNKVSLSWADGWQGSEELYFLVSDSSGNKIKSNKFNLAVRQPKNPPVLSYIPDVVANEGDMVVVLPHAIDADGEIVTYSYSGLFDKYGIYQSDYTCSGEYNITVTATDISGLTDSQEIKVRINNVNRAPYFVDTTNLTINANEGEQVNLVPEVVDPDGGNIRFIYSDKFDEYGKWTVDYDQAGTHNITVTATDDIDSVSENYTINVANVNRAPTVELEFDKYTDKTNSSFVATINAFDLDADNLTYELRNQAGSVLASGNIVNGTATETLSFSSVGDNKITAIVTDDDATNPLSGSNSKYLDITDPNTDKNDINALMGDFNGDGVLDVGIHNKSNGKWEISLSDHGEFYGAVDWKTGFGTSSDWAPNCGDFNGDGKSDAGLYNRTTGAFKVAYSSGSSFGTSSTFATLSGVSADWILSTGNYNGDKYSDAALYHKTNGTVRVYLGNGSGFDSYTNWLTGMSADYMPMSGDFNGDGLTDIAFYKSDDATFKVAFSNGRSFVDLRNWSTGFAADKPLQLSDFNGDGMTDVGYWDKDSTWYSSISTGEAFENKKAIWLSSFGSSSYGFASTGDFNGDGITDAALFDWDKEGIERWNIKNIVEDKSDLLIEINNNTGGKTQIEYTYTTLDGNEELPFPVYVASKTTSVDTIGDVEESYSMEFKFEGGYFDSTEKEFRGFEQVTTLDPISGNYTQLHFELGKTNGALKGQILDTIAYDGNGKIISEVINEYEVLNYGPANGLGFPTLISSTTTVWEENGTSLATKNEFEYDSVGNVTVTKMSGDLDKLDDDRRLETILAAPYDVGYNRATQVSLRDASFTTVERTNFEYDHIGRLAKEISWLKGSVTQPAISYTYDIYGNVLTVTDPLGHVTTTGYDTSYQAFPVTLTNQLGQSTTTTFDYRFGNELSVTDANNVSVSKTYDSIGRLLQEFNANDVAVATHSYPNWNTKVVEAAGITKTEHLDGLGRVYKTVSTGEDGIYAKNIVTETSFNNRGQVEWQSMPHYEDETADMVGYQRVEYDVRGRKVKAIADLPGTTEDFYSTIAYVEPLYTESTNPKGVKKGARKDVYGNITEVIDFTNEGDFVTTYTFNASDKLTQLTDSKGNTQVIEYDSLGRKVAMDDPDMGKWRYEYDIAGRLDNQVDAKGQTLSFEYDILNRMTKKYSGLGADRELLLENFYDDTNEPNRIGRLYKVEDKTGSTEFFFDNMGRKVKSDKTLNDVTYSVQRTYDDYDRLTSVVYPDGEVVNYGYDINSGALESVVGNENYQTNMNYNAQGKLLGKSFGNNTRTTYNYGYDFRLQNIKTYDGTNAVVQNLTYDFDSNGNIAELIDSINGNARTYEYDDFDRLTKAINIPTDYGQETFSYQYDEIGNMTYKSDVGFMSYGEGSGPHAVTSAGGYTFTYDANGNMLQNRGKTLKYNVENKMTSVIEGNKTTSFAYDGAGGRTRKTVSNGSEIKTTWYVGKLLEIDQDGNYKKHIFAGSDRVATVEGSETNYFHGDHLGSANIITNKNGEKISEYQYQPYGKVSKTVGTDSVNHKFTGQEFDSETDLHYYNARYYDSYLGRFTQADTIVPDPLNSQALNRYSYCVNNPLKYTDPSGHIFGFIAAVIIKIVIAAVKGAIIGAVVGGATAACTGGDIGEAMINGAISGAISGGLGGFGGGIVYGAIVGAAAGAGTAAIRGGDVGKGALSGAVGGAVGGGLNATVPVSQGACAVVVNGVRAAAIGAIAGGAANSSVGGSFADGAKTGAISGVIGYTYDQTLKAGKAWYANKTTGAAPPRTAADKSGQSTARDPGVMEPIELGEIEVIKEFSGDTKSSWKDNINWQVTAIGTTELIAGGRGIAIALAAEGISGGTASVYAGLRALDGARLMAFGATNVILGLSGQSRTAEQMIYDAVKDCPIGNRVAVEIVP